MLDACGHFLLVLGKILAWDTLARILNHVRVSSKMRTRHDAPKRLNNNLDKEKKYIPSVKQFMGV